jgi:hypothetical protein
MRAISQVIFVVDNLSIILTLYPVPILQFYATLGANKLIHAIIVVIHIVTDIDF